MDAQPLVSVIIPSYNHQDYIELAVRSAVNQTYPNKEILVVDDGSTDNSLNILQKLQSELSFKLIAQKNSGLAATYNKLIEQCTGNYIAILESDDYWMLDKLEKQVTFLQQNPSFGGCGGNVLHVNEDNVILPYYLQRFFPFRAYAFEDVFAFNAYLPSISMMFRGDLLKSITPYPTTLKFIDLFNHLKITNSNLKLALLPDLLGCYRIHSKNTTKKNKVMLMGKLDILKEYCNVPGYTKALFKVYKNYWFHQCLFFVPSRLFPFKRS